MPELLLLNIGFESFAALMTAPQMFVVYAPGDHLVPGVAIRLVSLIVPVCAFLTTGCSPMCCSHFTVERSTPAALGLKRERWILRLVLSLIVAGLFLPMLFFEGDLASVGWENVAEAASFERSFAIVLSACIWKRRLAPSRRSC
jgi:hypothetical protein